MALGHGLQDAGKTMGIVVLALTVGGYQHDSSIPTWSRFPTALVISAGTYSGGWRIMRTLGRKIIHLDPPQGFAAEVSAASILYVAGLGLRGPDLDYAYDHLNDHGFGATKRLSAVRWGVARNIVTVGADVPRGRSGRSLGLCADDPLSSSTVRKAQGQPQRPDM